MSPNWSSSRVWSVRHRQFLSVYEKSNNTHVCKFLGTHVFKWFYVWYEAQLKPFICMQSCTADPNFCCSIPTHKTPSAAKVIFSVCNWEATSFHTVCLNARPELVSWTVRDSASKPGSFQWVRGKCTRWAMKMKRPLWYGFHINASYARKKHNRIQKVQFKMGGWGKRKFKKEKRKSFAGNASDWQSEVKAETQARWWV